MWCAGAALTVRPVRLEPHQYLRFTYRGHFLKSPKNATKINQKNIPSLSLTNISELAPQLVVWILLHYTIELRMKRLQPEANPLLMVMEVRLLSIVMTKESVRSFFNGLKNITLFFTRFGWFLGHVADFEGQLPVRDPFSDCSGDLRGRTKYIWSFHWTATVLQFSM